MMRKSGSTKGGFKAGSDLAKKIEVKGNSRAETRPTLEEAKVDEDLEARALLAGALSAALEVVDTSQQLVVSSTVENLPDSLASQKQVNESFRALAEEILRSEACRFGEKEKTFTRYSKEHEKNIIETISETLGGDESVDEQSAQYDPARPQYAETIESSDAGTGQCGIKSQVHRKKRPAKREYLGTEAEGSMDDEPVRKRSKRQTRKGPESIFLDVEAKPSGKGHEDDSEGEISDQSFINDDDSDHNGHAI